MTFPFSFSALMRYFAAVLLVIGLVPHAIATPVVLTEVEETVIDALVGASENPVQAAMGRVVGTICPGRTAIVDQDLQDRCGEIVRSVVGNDNPEDNQRARDAAQALAPEEDAILGTSQVDTNSGHVDAISQRISNVRGGATSGIVQRSHNGTDWSGGAAGDTAHSPWGFFVNGLYASTDRDTTARESGFDADDYGVTAGVDYTFSDKVLVGAAFGYKNSEADINSNGGEIETDSYSFFGYWSMYPDDYWFVDGMVGYTDSNHDQIRNVVYSILTSNVNNAALSETDSEEWSASLSAGRNFYLGSWVAAPMARVEYSDVSIDGFSERMRDSAASALGSGVGIRVDEQDFESLMLAAGASLSTEWATSFGSVFPEVSAEYVHEFKNSNKPIIARYVNDSSNTPIVLLTDAPDRNFFNIGAGLTAMVSGNTSAYVRYQGLFGYKHLDLHAFEVGIRASF